MAVEVPDKEDHDCVQEQVWQLEKRVAELVRKTNFLEREITSARSAMGLTVVSFEEESDAKT